MTITASPLWYLTLVIITTILLGLSAIVLLAARINNSVRAARIGRYMIWVASLVAAPVVIIGFSLNLDYHAEGGSVLQWALFSSVVFWLLSVWSVRDAYEKRQPDLSFVVIAVAALASVLFTGYRSGKTAFNRYPGQEEAAFKKDVQLLFAEDKPDIQEGSRITQNAMPAN
jgi:hypothetical protein